MLNHEKTVEQLERHRRHGEEIEGGDHLDDFARTTASACRDRLDGECLADIVPRSAPKPRTRVSEARRGSWELPNAGFLAPNVGLEREPLG
jgi:hypothetical protein